ncbi:MAG TPA: FAD binding domain-containing protein [Candidatus Nitrosotalea sp.]|nr:FAD binding domain-containing protein [Candidatus Nitrosotalea sp.]
MEISVPRSLPDALVDLSSHPDSRLIAGGTDVMVDINFGRSRPERLVSLRRLGELRRIERGERIFIGSGCTFTDLAAGVDEPSLARAAATVGSVQIRNSGTVGGNLGTCSPAGDALPALLALDADVELGSSAGRRVITLGEFMIGPRRTALRPGELILGVSWRRAGSAQAFMKVGSRNAMVIAVASLALVLDRAQRRVRLALGSVAPTIVRCPQAEALAEAALADQDWAPRTLPDAVLEEFGHLAVRAAQPIDDVRGSASYRRHVVRVMAQRALEQTCASL